MGEVDRRVAAAIEGVLSYLKENTASPGEAIYVLVEVITKVDQDYRYDGKSVEKLIEMVSNHLKTNDEESARAVGMEH